MVIPRFVGQALAGEPISVFGDGEQSRCFAHVRDVVGALVELILKPESIGQVYNIGSDQEITVNALARRVLEMTNSRSEIVHVPYDEAYAEGFEDMRRRMPDISKIARLVAWAPQHDIQRILHDVIDYMRSRPETQAA